MRAVYDLQRIEQASTCWSSCTTYQLLSDTLTFPETRQIRHIPVALAWETNCRHRQPMSRLTPGTAMSPTDSSIRNQKTENGCTRPAKKIENRKQSPKNLFFVECTQLEQHTLQLQLRLTILLTFAVAWETTRSQGAAGRSEHEARRGHISHLRQKSRLGTLSLRIAFFRQAQYRQSSPAESSLINLVKFEPHACSVRPDQPFVNAACMMGLHCQSALDCWLLSSANCSSHWVVRGFTNHVECCWCLHLSRGETRVELITGAGLQHQQHRVRGSEKAMLVSMAKAPAGEGTGCWWMRLNRQVSAAFDTSTDQRLILT